MAKEQGGKPKSKSGVNAFRLALASLDIADQKSLFDRMEPAMRLALWQDRLQSAAKEVSGRRQKTALRDLCSRLSEELYSDSNEAVLAEFKSYWATAEDKAYGAFEPHPEILDAFLTKLGTGNTAAPIPKKQALPSCTCATSANGDTRLNDCGGMSNACQAGACTPTFWGCGFLWLFSCDGLCTGRAFDGAGKTKAGKVKKS